MVQRTDSDSFWGFHDLSSCVTCRLCPRGIPEWFMFFFRAHSPSTCWASFGEPRPSHSKLSRRKYLQCPPARWIAPSPNPNPWSSTVNIFSKAACTTNRGKKQRDFSIFLEICWSQSLFAGTLHPNLPWSVYQSNLSANFVASTHPKNASASWEHRPKISQINWMQIQ